MLLLVECIILCFLFTIMVLPAQYKDPLKLIMSYPPAIIKRVEQLPEYQGMIKQREHSHIKKKLFGVLLFVAVLSLVAYYSGCKDFWSAFVHVFVLFMVVNLYDLLILDWGIACHSKKLRIPGTEDMEKEYKDYLFHLKGACKGIMIGTVVAVLSGCVISVITLLV